MAGEKKKQNQEKSNGEKDRQKQQNEMQQYLDYSAFVVFQFENERCQERDFLTNHLRSIQFHRQQKKKEIKL